MRAAGEWVTNGRSALTALLALVIFGGIPGSFLRSAQPALPAHVDAQSLPKLVVSAVSSGEPIGGARVRVFASSDESGATAIAVANGDTRTDEKGRAVVDSLKPGAYWVIVDAAGYARASSQTLVAVGDRTLTFELGPEEPVSVIVRDETGQPVNGAEVEVSSLEPIPVSGRTGADGQLALKGAGPPPWTLRARAAGYDEATARNAERGKPIPLTIRRLGGLVVHVARPDGTPAADARIWVGSASLWPARETKTDANGLAKIAGLGAGMYSLRASLGSLVSPIEDAIELDRGEFKDVSLALHQGRYVTVHVTDGDAADAPRIASARVTLAESGLSAFPLEAVTTKDGSARMGPIAMASASVTAQADGFVAEALVNVPDGPSPDVNVPLARAGEITGKVVDSRGFPIDGATVELFGTDFHGGPIADHPRRTRFRTAHFTAMLGGPKQLLPAGELGVMPGAIPAIPRLGGGGGGASNPTLASLGLGSGFGASNGNGSRDRGEVWSTAGDGTFRASPASPGHVRAIVRHPEFVETVSELVTLRSGGSAHVDVVMRAGGLLDGRVVDDRGNGVSGAHVSIASLRGTLERATTSATDGTFAFASVPELVVVRVSGPDDTSGDVALRTSVEVPDHGRKSVTLTLPSQRPPLAIRVTDERGSPIDLAQVSAQSLEPETPLRQTVFTGRQGEAELRNAKGLFLRVEVRSPGFAPKIATFEKTGEKGNDKLAIVLQRAETAIGSVKTTRGDPIRDAEVTLQTEAGPRHARTRADGTYVLTDLGRGTTRIRVRAPGYAPVERTVTVHETAFDRKVELPKIELAPEASVEGTVVDERGDPLQGARVGVGHVPSFTGGASTHARTATTDAQGRFRLGELPDGEVELEAYAADVGRGTTEVRCVAGRPTVNIRITVRKTASSKSDPLTGASVAISLGETDEHEIVIVTVVDGSEAERAGLRAGDLLLTIDSAPVQTLEQARARLNGPPGDDVVIQLRRGEQSMTLRVPREAVRR